MLVEAEPQEKRSLLMTILISWFPTIFLIAVFLFLMRQMQGGRGGAFSFGKNRARVFGESENTITFEDVAGCDEAKEEVVEIVDFLKSPSKFRRLGAKIPRGVLLVGNPRHRQNAARQSDCRRSEGPLLQRLRRLRLCRNVRRRRRRPRARHV